MVAMVMKMMIIVMASSVLDDTFLGAEAQTVGKVT